MVVPVGTHLRAELAQPTLADLVEDAGIDVEDEIVIEEIVIEEAEFLEAPAATAADPFSSLVETLVDVARGAGDMRAAAALPALLRDGLLDSEAVSAIAIDSLREGGMIGMSGPAAVEAGAVTQDELDALVSGVSAAAARGEAFVSVTMFGVLGRRPG